MNSEQKTPEQGGSTPTVASSQCQPTLEAVLSSFDVIPPGQNLGKDFKLLIPNRLTFGGEVVPRGKILSAVHKQAYSLGYEPDGFTEEPEGTVFKYTPIDRGNLEVGYYTELQNRLFNVFLYVSCDQRNFSTFSIALASVFLDAGSFFDSLAQTFIRNYANAGNSFLAASKVHSFHQKIQGKSYFTMDNYQQLLESEFQFSDKVLNLNSHGGDFYSQPTACFRDVTGRFDVRPFAEWASSKNPKWWRAYTDVKHDRIKHIEEATLGNTIMALGAVLIVLCFYHKRFMKSHSQALETYRLFTPRYWEVKGTMSVSHPIFTEVHP